MHEEHIGSRTAGDHERLVEELRSLLLALAARAEEWLNTLSRGEHSLLRTFAEKAGPGADGCPLCVARSVLREANARSHAGGLPEQLVGLLTSLREAFTAATEEPAAGEPAAGEPAAGEPSGDGGRWRSGGADSEPAESRVRSITVRRVHGNVLAEDPPA
ncbi:hypothetical protein CDG81_16170 [Actinopolyspora erythraea]|uniref:Uncharacterized protein n=1 Tax=Actinopolyspora erythraea TaxID=414996 RepID=A0A223RUI6_9ACTN|nr:hypothetical protein [Actinopolyspora erythraea]ASU79552.1 hypothetical protein CDG81_16170 [Actinopolyspora erythraea]